MRKQITMLFTSLLLSLALLLGLPNTTWASSDIDSDVTTPAATYVSHNEETGYYIYIDDWADLLTDAEESELLETMEPITAYGNVAFVSISMNPTYSTERYAKDYYQEHFGYSSGTVFLIDMEERYIWIHSDGEIYRTVTKSYATTITDNVYSYASREDYLTCASKGFEQINTLMEGRHIAQPMKYISNALLAIAIALLINYFVVRMSSRSRKASTSQLIDGTYYKTEIKNPRTEFIKQTRRYSPQSRSSSGGGGGGGRSGGGGGGGGGGHRF